MVVKAEDEGRCLHGYTYMYVYIYMYGLLLLAKCVTRKHEYTLTANANVQSDTKKINKLFSFLIGKRHRGRGFDFHVAR